MEASCDTLVEQAHQTADKYFHYALKTLEASGLEFTAADAVALARVAAMDFHSACSVRNAQTLAEELRAILLTRAAVE